MLIGLGAFIVQMYLGVEKLTKYDLSHVKFQQCLSTKTYHAFVFNFKFI
jgi:hypothetical protein